MMYDVVEIRMILGEEHCPTTGETETVTEEHPSFINHKVIRARQIHDAWWWSPLCVHLWDDGRLAPAKLEPPLTAM